MKKDKRKSKQKFQKPNPNSKKDRFLNKFEGGYRSTIKFSAEIEERRKMLGLNWLITLKPEVETKSTREPSWKAAEVNTQPFK